MDQSQTAGADPDPPSADSEKRRLFSESVDLRVGVDDAVELLFDHEAQDRWLGSGCRLGRQPDASGAVDMVGGRYRLITFEAASGREFTFRTETVSGGRRLSTTLTVSVEPKGSKKERSTVSISEHGTKSDIHAKHIGEWHSCWTAALSRLSSLTDTIEKRRKPAQAVVVIHGIGEPVPGDTLRRFVVGVMGAGSRVRSKPDHVSTTYELRRLSMAAQGDIPKTDFFEFYWSHHIRDTTRGQVLKWLVDLLVRKPSDVPEKIRPVWYVVVGAVLVLAVSILVLVAPRAGDLQALAGTLSLISSVVSLLGSGFLIHYLGDAARYLSASPANVDVRDKIRSEGVGLLLDLHLSNRYQRIVLVGHSLGSVIAYDIVSHLWAYMHLAHLGPRRAKRKRAQELHTFSGSAEGAQARQHAAWQECRRATQPWLITDLVTLGSPLTHAELLLASTDRPLHEQIDSRELAQCPPIRDERGDADGLAFFRHSPYTDRDGRTGTFLFFHHAAPYSVTRWTNLYFPVRGGVFGDFVGGSVAGFGDWIVDREVPLPPSWRAAGRAFTHTKYWKPSPVDSEAPHLGVLREALRLDCADDLSRLAATIPPYALMDPPRFAPLHGRDIEVFFTHQD